MPRKQQQIAAVIEAQRAVTARRIVHIRMRMRARVGGGGGGECTLIVLANERWYHDFGG